MSTIPDTASVTEALHMIDDAMSYFETADFRAMSVEARLEYLEALDRVTAISHAFRARLLTEYIRRLWDGTVTWPHDRPMTGSAKVNWSGVRAARKS
jgi:hypothetical protein